MQQEPKNGLDVRIPFAFPVQGRVRPEEILRRKLMQKMMARRERRVLAATTTVRRAV
jgi:hypothetical protein